VKSPEHLFSAQRSSLSVTARHSGACVCSRNNSC